MSEAEIIKALAKAIKIAVAKSTYLVHEDAQARCPRGNSILADTLRMDENTGEVWSEQTYAPIVEYGLKGKIIVPKEKSILAWTKPGITRPDSNDKEAWKSLRKRGLAIFAKKSKGIETIGTGQDGEGLTKISFLRPALWENKKEIMKIFSKEISKVGGL
jgi:hypothetical protein